MGRGQIGKENSGSNSSLRHNGMVMEIGHFPRRIGTRSLALSIRRGWEQKWQLNPLHALINILPFLTPGERMICHSQLLEAGM